MKKLILVFSLLSVLLACPAKADFWGGDIPLLAEIVTNTLHSLTELRKQTTLLNDEMDGIKDKINRIKTIETLVNPSTWSEWKDPGEALRRLRKIYHTLPPE